VLHSSAHSSNSNSLTVAQVQHGDEDDPEKGLIHYHTHANAHYNHVQHSGAHQHSSQQQHHQQQQQQQYRTTVTTNSSSSNSKKKPGSAAVTSIVRGVARTLQLGSGVVGVKGGGGHSYDCMQTYSLLPVKALRRVRCVHHRFIAYTAVCAYRTAKRQRLYSSRQCCAVPLIHRN
jgi:hypothetical protein